jgi:predicted MFS family arabinose efflux permease
VGPAAAINLFAAIGGEYHVAPDTVIVLTGFGGSLLTAAGCLAGGAVADRTNRWRAFLTTGLLLGVFATIVAAAPHIGIVFKSAVPVYLFLSGIVNATYTALLLEVIGRRRHATAALYTWLNNLGNLPVAYMTWLDGQGHRLWGTTGLFAVDGLGNVVPILLLFWIVVGTGIDRAPERLETEATAA